MTCLIAALLGLEAARADDPLVPEDDDPALPMPGAPEPEPVVVPVASTPVAPVDQAFNYDSLLVGTVQPDAAEWAADAAALEERLLARFGATNQLTPMSEVPKFEVQGYDARTYLLGCPPGRYGGCVLVIGQRAGVERAVGATVRRDPDEYEQGKTMVSATFHIVDVGDGREVVSLTVPMPEGSEDAVITGIMSLFDEVVSGERALKDLREREAPDQKELTAARREQIAKALDRLEGKLGVAVVSEVEARLERPKLTRADLAEYEGRDDRPPWERLGMSSSEYLRFANSGTTYEEWQRAGWGRTANVVVRVGGGVGPGPWDQRYVSQSLLGRPLLEVVDSAQLLEVVRASSPSFDFEVGVGILPFLEVAFAGAARPGEVSYVSDRDVEGDYPAVTNPSNLSITTWQFGARAHVAPFPRWPVRPTLGAGVASWKGAGIPAEGGLARIDAPTATFLEVLPGVEVTATDHVVPYARLLTSVPVGGTQLTQRDAGEGLVTLPTPTGDPGIGLAVQLGLQFRFGPVVKPDTSVGGT